LMAKEQESWRRSIIGPGNDPSAIPEYFTTKLQILDQARNRILSSVPSTSTLPTTEQRLSNAVGRAADMGVNVGGIGAGAPRVPQQPQAQSQQQQAIAAFGSYEPDKYEYGTNPETGRFARRPRSQ
jgi:hypothetical protein